MTIPQFNILLALKPCGRSSIRITRYLQMIVYDLPDVSIMLAKVGTDPITSASSIGDNVESGSVMFSMDGRFSDYEGHLTSVLTFGTEAGVNTPDVGKVV